MAEILKEWLTERLRRPITWGPDEFVGLMRDGHVIANLLLSYHVINDDKFFLIRASNTSKDTAVSNWSYLTEWLHEIDINVTPSEVKNILAGKSAYLLRLFYRLFLHLDRRDRTNFLKRERKMASGLVEKKGYRFKVGKIESEDTSFIEELSKPLLDDRRFIEWQKMKADKVKDLHEYMKFKYNQRLDNLKDDSNLKSIRSKLKLKSVEKKDMEKFPTKLQNYNYKKLKELEKKAGKLKDTPVDPEWVPNYMQKLYSKMHKKSDVEEFQKQLRTELTNTVWDTAIEEEESMVDNELAKKVMKLSQFEKQMATQIMETKQQARNVIRNRVVADQEFTKQRDQQFSQFLDNLKEQLQLELLEIDFEKNRQNMLHKLLYDEKMRRKRKFWYEICYETMLSIVDYAVKCGYFKKLLGGEEVPDHYIREWKSLYFKQQPIFDFLEPLDNIIEPELPFEEEEIEDINKLELDRQNVLNEYDFIEYHSYLGAWELENLIPNYDPKSEETEYRNLGLRILGHVVYTLLEMKYPLPTKKIGTVLPEYSCKAILRGLPDKAFTVTLQTLLTFQRIHVTRIENVINYCLKKYKTEMVGITDVDISYEKFIHAASDKNKGLIKAMKAAEESMLNVLGESHGAGTASNLSPGNIPLNCKQTQTPKLLPEDELKLSAPAELGRYAYEALFFGDSLTDYLISSMIVEYLHSQNYISGFVLINYPNSYREAQILCEAFTGRAPPDQGDIEDSDDIFLEESIAKHRKKVKDPFIALRSSKLVEDPHMSSDITPFKTYFTCYMDLKESHNISNEASIWNLPKESTALLDRFYSVMGINYSMYYETFSKEFLAQICWYLIGDLTIQSNDFEKLFGPNVFTMLVVPRLPVTIHERPEDQRMKSMKEEGPLTAKRSTIRKEKKTSGQSLTKALSSMAEIAVQSLESYVTVPSPIKSLSEELNEFTYDRETSSQPEPAIKLLAGEDLWVYANMPIVESVGVGLASCWEEIERAYIDDMSKLFLAKRILCKSLVPYVRYIHDKVEQIITMPSEKQNLVSKFQHRYNEFENDWRDVNLIKNEWHCRVKELQQNLYKICDDRKVFAERKRQELIADCWMMDELSSLANVYTSSLQAELNRFVMTYQTLHDFYFSMLKRIPSTDRVSTKELPKINREFDEHSSKRGEEKFKQLKAAYMELHQNNMVVDSSNNPYNNVVESNAKTALKLIKDLNDSYRTVISKEYSEIAKIIVPPRQIDGSGDSVEEILSPEEVFKNTMLKCIEEWTMGMNGEMYRANLRIAALLQRCYRDMQLFTDVIHTAFNNICNAINSYYMNEIRSVDWLCKYFQLSVEEGRKIPETLILEHDTFMIDPNLLQFSPPVFTEPDPKGPFEDLSDFEFSASQLERLRSQLKLCAPTGLALQRSFVYLLIDFIFFGKETCEGSMFPEAWKKVDPLQVSKLVPLLFGESIYIDWRDFLIYCLTLEYPTQEELMEVRHDFRCQDPDSTELISKQHFLEEKFWFESRYDAADANAQHRLSLLKNFLFKLFETQSDMLNYSAFLLAFCKNEDPIEGFVMALSMAVGKKVMYHIEECRQIVARKIEQKRYRDASRACALKCVQQILDKCINNVMMTCEGFVVTEMKPAIKDEDGTVTSKKGAKKGKKGKDKDTSQSARAAKPSSPTGKKKASASAVDVHTTFVCPPCKPASVPRAGEVRTPEMEKDDVIDYEDDPYLVYSISQAVIWNVLQICLPWQFQLVPEERPTAYVGQIKDIFKVLEKDTDDGDIYICKFLIEPDVCKLLHKAKKFTALNIAEEVSKVFEK